MTAGADSYAGQRVAISGATGGLGRGLAQAFADEGAHLLLIDMDRGRLDGLADTLPSAEVAVCDQSDPKAIARTCAAVGPVDVFVNNAGVMQRKGLIDLADDEIDLVVDVNLKGSLRMAIGMAREMHRDRGGAGGVIVNIATQHVFAGAAGRGLYAASKAGIAQFTRAAAVEWAPGGIRVFAVAPGPVANDMTAGAREDPGYVSAVTARMPIGRFLENQEIVDVILATCRPSMSAIVGTCILADGGGIQT